MTRILKIETTDLSHGWKQYTLINDQGMQVRFLNYGGIITDIITPDREGNMENIVLAYKDLKDYQNNSNYFGALIGRVAGRIENATFEIDQVTYPLEKNDDDNHLHGGSSGFHQVIWQTREIRKPNHIGVELFHISEANSGGYPGTIHATIHYTLNNRNEFQISYEAKTTKKTALSLTNHSYFNLSGNAKRTVHEHEVSMNGTQIIELDDNLIPTGHTLETKDTTFDFETPRKLATGITDFSQQHVNVGHGYDHYFLFNRAETGCVTVKENTSGRMITIETNQPGMVMYTANALDENHVLTGGISSKKHLGVCFETQASSARLHHEKLPNIILSPNETYQKQTTFTFSTDADER